MSVFIIVCNVVFLYSCPKYYVLKMQCIIIVIHVYISIPLFLQRL